MTTIIRKFAAPAAFSDSLVLDLEPAIVLPAATLGAYRFKVSRDFSSPNKKGPWPAMTEGSAGTASYRAASVVYEGRQAVAAATQFPADFLTSIMVIKQNNGAVNKFYAGVSDNNAGLDNAFGLHTVSAGGTFSARFGTGGNISMPSVDGERWEMICAGFNRTNGSMKLYRPRTSTLVSGTFTEPSSPVGQFQVLGKSNNTTFAGIIEAALSVHVREYMSQADLDAVYSSAKQSLAVGGVQI